MAPGVCVTSFRMFMRRSDFNLQLNHGLRITAITAPNDATTTQYMNSWNFRRRNYSSEKGCLETEKKGKTATSATTTTTTNAIKISQTKRGNNKLVNSELSTTPPTLQTAAAYESDRQTANKIEIQHTNDAAAHLKSLADTDLTQIKLSELRTHCRAYGLSSTGKKQVLLERLQTFLQHAHKPSEADKVGAAAAAAEHTISPHYTTIEHDSHDYVKAPEIRLSSEVVASSVTLADPLPTTLDTKTHMSKNLNCKDVGLHVQAKDINHSTLKTELAALPPNSEQLQQQQQQQVKKKQLKFDEVVVQYIQGLPHITVPLPSREEKCRFALKPISHRVGDLIDMLKVEDRGIDHATIRNEYGVRIASTCNIESLMDEPFWLHINDCKYRVVPPKKEHGIEGDLNKLGNIKTLVAQLYEALHVGEFNAEKEIELREKLESLNFKLVPMEEKISKLTQKAQRKANLVTWAGLVLMGVQFGVLARLTWWEYSWDIMEPVTYFVTYGAAMGMYAYFCVTKKEYNYEGHRDREYLMSIHKSAQKDRFDIDEYNSLKRQIADLEYNLRRLHDPINLQLPPHVVRAQTATPPTLPATPKDDTVAKKIKDNEPKKPLF